MLHVTHSISTSISGFLFPHPRALRRAPEATRARKLCLSNFSSVPAVERKLTATGGGGAQGAGEAELIKLIPMLETIGESYTTLSDRRAWGE